MPLTREEEWVTFTSLVISFPLPSCPEGVHQPQKTLHGVSKLALCGGASSYAGLNIYLQWVFGLSGLVSLASVCPKLFLPV